MGKMEESGAPTLPQKNYQNKENEDVSTAISSYLSLFLLADRNLFADSIDLKPKPLQSQIVIVVSASTILYLIQPGWSGIIFTFVFMVNFLLFKKILLWHIKSTGIMRLFIFSRFNFYNHSILL